jgi:hypothetical protein
MFDEKEYNYSKLVPFVYWAQNNSSVFLKFELADIDENNLKMLENTIQLQFLCKKTELIYEFNLKLFGEVEDDVQYLSNERCINIIIKKKEEGYWDRLGSDKSDLKMHIKVNWDLWREEDDEEEQGGDSNFDYESMMQQMMGGMGGMSGMDPSMMGNFGGDEDEVSDEVSDAEEEEDAVSDEVSDADHETKVINTNDVSDLVSNIESVNLC